MRQVWLWLRRACYAGIFLAAGFYYIYVTSYLSWILFLAAVLLPVGSYLLSLILLRARRITLLCRPNLGNVSDGFSMALSYPAPLLPTMVRVRLQIRNLFTGEIKSQWLLLTPDENGTIELGQYTSPSMGVMECRLVKAVAWDFLRFFPIRIPVSKPVRVLLTPAAIPFPEDKADDIRTNGMAEPIFVKDGNGEREWKDIREYREGDLLRDIHWKLTSRRDQVIVREFEETGSAAIWVFLEWAGPAPQLERKLGKAFGLLRTLHQLGFRCRFQIIRARSDEFPAVQDAAELEALLWELLGQSCPAEEAAVPALPVIPEGSLVVEAEAVTLYQNGGSEEVVA